MKKDIEWLKKEINKVNPFIELTWTWQKKVLNLINQLDEPEVTHEQVVEWIENNEFYCHATAETVLENAVDKGELGYYGTKYSVVEKPVIPKFVAEWITNHREKFDLYPALRTSENNTLVWGPIYEWYRMNTHKFVNAYLTGEYEVEEEQRYYALDSDDIPLLERVGNQIQRATTELSIYEKGRDNSRFKLTEQEIKGYDKRYWPFAEPAEQADFRLLF